MQPFNPFGSPEPTSGDLLAALFGIGKIELKPETLGVKTIAHPYDPGGFVIELGYHETILGCHYESPNLVFHVATSSRHIELPHGAETKKVQIYALNLNHHVPTMGDIQLERIDRFIDDVGHIVYVFQVVPNALAQMVAARGAAQQGGQDGKST